MKIDKNTLIQGFLLVLCLCAFTWYVYRDGITPAAEPLPAVTDDIPEPIAAQAVEPLKDIEILQAKRVFVFTEPAPRESSFSEAEEELLARVVKRKGDDLPLEGKLAIIATIINRVNSPIYPNTIEDVIKGDIEQYELSRRAEPDVDCYLAVDLYADGDFPQDMFYFSQDEPSCMGYPFMRVNDVYFSTESGYGN